ncbi:MAG TPA: alcohol dehydrogenase catalytic domain-containing protein, partial [Intrasporangium sp.]|nr:alcohol dehydrogenase catalytic domain-containing protein [Intrasporangium sp.]
MQTLHMHRTQPRTMRLVTQDTFGGPDVLHIAETPVPQPAAGEVLVAVAARGVNPVDAAVRAGFFPPLGEPPFTVGWDIAGTVVAVDAAVTDLAIGDRVFGMPAYPRQAAGYADYVVAR